MPISSPLDERVKPSTGFETRNYFGANGLRLSVCGGETFQTTVRNALRQLKSRAGLRVRRQGRRAYRPRLLRGRCDGRGGARRPVDRRWLGRRHRSLPRRADLVPPRSSSPARPVSTSAGGAPKPGSMPSSPPRSICANWRSGWNIFVIARRRSRRGCWSSMTTGWRPKWSPRCCGFVASKRRSSPIRPRSSKPSIASPSISS